MAALQLLLEYGNFFNINISQGSVATSVVFKYKFITHLHQSPTVKEFGQEAQLSCDASGQLKSCQLPRNSAETTYTTSPNQIDGMKL